jgi:hypothetical protein
MPFIRSTASEHCTLLVLSIILLGKIMLSCSYCAEKKLLYIVITSPFKRQPSSYSKYTLAKMQSSYNIHSVSSAECTYLARLTVY